MIMLLLPLGLIIYLWIGFLCAMRRGDYVIAIMEERQKIAANVDFFRRHGTPEQVMDWQIRYVHHDLVYGSLNRSWDRLGAKKFMAILLVQNVFFWLPTSIIIQLSHIKAVYRGKRIDAHEKEHT